MFQSADYEIKQKSVNPPCLEFKFFANIFFIFKHRARAVPMYTLMPMTTHIHITHSPMSTSNSLSCQIADIEIDKISIDDLLTTYVPVVVERITRPIPTVNLGNTSTRAKYKTRTQVNKFHKKPTT